MKYVPPIAFQQIVEASGGMESPLYQKGWLGGSIFALVVGLIIIGGIRSIGKVTEKLVPMMAILYITSCLYIIISNYHLIPQTFNQIFLSAFNFEATTGGILGSLIAC